VVERWGKWLLLGPRDLEKSERWFDKYGSATVLFGRLIPVVRSFISLPAGIAEMNRARFATLTMIGSAAWVALLSSLGYAAGSNWHRVSGDFKNAELPTIIVIVALLVAAFLHRLRSVRRQNAH
jgi:membrane protein DedA with SNARE-associated domain